MTNEEYLAYIEEIEKEIEVDPQTAIEKLDDLYSIRPVRNLWFLARAKALLKQKRMKDVFMTLQGKLFLKIPSKVNEEILHVMQKAYPESNTIDRDRFEFMIQTLYDFEREDVFYRDFLCKLKKLREDFLKNIFSATAIEQLARYYYIQNNFLLYMALKVLKDRFKYVWKEERVWVEQSYNMGFFFEMLQPMQRTPFILLETDFYDQEDCNIMIKILVFLQKKVFLIKAPQSSSNIRIKQVNNYQEFILKHRSEENGAVIFQAILLQDENDKLYDNRDAILSFIMQKEIKEQFAVALCSGILCDVLGKSQWGKSFFQRLLPFQSNFLNKNMSGGWIGNYLSYCDFLYGCNTKSLLDSANCCDFSIVIPVRNTAYCLRETIKTCLNQRFQGSFEIILSDNSMQGNMEIYDLCQEINDQRIRYFRTPRDLPLSKSFEFAFLQARGEFVFAIGSDDGVLPWALDVLQTILNQSPEIEFLTWERGFYAWPGFNGGQQNQFVIPRSYKKGIFKLTTKDAKKSLEKVIENPEHVYDLPLLYLNSGYKRNYIKKILMKTGRLWDGICQDIYMGIVNLAINDTYTVLEYPLTIAGMSKESIGVRSNESYKNFDTIKNENECRKIVSNVGAYAPTRMEDIVPCLNYDTASVYRSLVRIIARSKNSDNYLNQLNWRKIYFNLAKNLSFQDLRLEDQLNAFRYAASNFSPEFRTFVETEICQLLLSPVQEEPSYHQQKRLYEVGISEKGQVILDASNFGVKNIYDAVRLFENLTGL